MDNETKEYVDIPGDATQPAATVAGEVVEKPARAWRPQDADVFEYKQNVRQRVRSSQAHPNAVFHKAKEPPKIDDGAKRRVAVYARVSTKSKNQISSIENQQKYYTKRIEDEPDWDMGRIYSDEGISGTSVRKRKAFQEMIRDAKAKDMDLILCASISRFSRNLQECLEYIDILRSSSPSHPVGVYFETENIYTLDPNSDQQLEIYAMLADWESANKSRRMILSYDQRICTGQYPVADLLGYRHTIDGDLVIQEDEAITVRFIFLAYILGYTYAEIPDWYVFGRFYKHWGYLSAKGVKSLVYEPNRFSNHMFKDDFLYISYDAQIVPNPDRQTTWYKYTGFDEYIYGSAIISFLRAAENYSGYDITEIKAQIEEKRLWFKQTYPDDYALEVTKDRPFFDASEAAE